ncbi:60S ribosomal protein L6, mitochondrial-like [Spinacia oleracea]|uniref:60S ribosomal protein L6, mitochondrial-like n=1 Tax=Spinacia oleracea TaxID=3562 RepID=A0A9R0IUS5_SPIOL|nr:60S ribosomal protein L6, mitochondrial-like [Spinacia oleracea]
MEAKFFRVLKLIGSGYKARAEAEGRVLLLKVGYPYEIELQVPPAVRVFCFKPDIICCAGIDKQRTHQFAAAVRRIRPHTAYKTRELRGMKYKDEEFNLKPVKEKSKS